ncbi:hypothetical protein E5D57_005182 [Metarhizium anisopliae]|nr:hypothetical protein E5D57_005182 [Metarhizium anisopliae]
MRRRQDKKLSSIVHSQGRGLGSRRVVLRQVGVVGGVRACARCELSNLAGACSNSNRRAGPTDQRFIRQPAGTDLDSRAAAWRNFNCAGRKSDKTATAQSEARGGQADGQGLTLTEMEMETAASTQVSDGDGGKDSINNEAQALCRREATRQGAGTDAGSY